MFSCEAGECLFYDKNLFLRLKPVTLSGKKIEKLKNRQKKATSKNKIKEPSSNDRRTVYLKDRIC